MIEEYIRNLKKVYLKLPIIKSDTTLKDGQWNKTSYEQLSLLIFDKLNEKLPLDIKQKKGATVSARTLYNIFEFKRKIKIPLDQRSLNTLDKLSLFADYKCWNNFVNKSDSALSKKKGKKAYKEKVKHLILGAKAAEFHSYNSLPQVNPNGLENFFTEHSSAFAEIKSLIEEYAESDCIISNPYNPSSYEILSIDIEKSKLKDDHYLVSTEEYWILCWYDSISKKYIKREKKLSKHKYVVVYEQSTNKWLIDVNASN